LKAGEQYQRYKLLQILLVKSMNDVARCLARDNAGSLEDFAAKMNAKARTLGMANSNFVNPNGFPPQASIPPHAIWPKWPWPRTAARHPQHCPP
jgi:D-alanyl-D-alanine carboxypeptidase (penicillin-binding protein 5/6)